MNYKLYENMLLSMKRNSKNGVASVAKPMYVLAIIEGIETYIITNNRIFSTDY